MTSPPRGGTLRAPLGLTLFLFLLILLDTSIAVKWLGLSQSDLRFWNQTRHCMHSKREDGLRKHQSKLCKQNLELMGIVVHATRQTVQVCQELFQYRRWNCSSINSAPNYLADLTGGSREQAYVFALSTASLTQTVSKACAVGATTKCSCGRLPREAPPGDFKWGGCGDDLQFGLAFSRLFTQESSKKKKKISKKTLVNEHNNAVGRKAVADSLSTACKCHGVSGSCSIKTCWKALPDLRGIGVELQKKYALAVEVDTKRVGKGSKRILYAVNRYRNSFGDGDLIYYTKSSDYCLPDTTLGSVGTTGRKCRKGYNGSAGCRSMCCGRGYTTDVVEIKQRCDCKYYWCCYVKCKTCIKKVEMNRCR